MLRNCFVVGFDQLVGNAGCGQLVTDIVKIPGQLLLLGVGVAGE